MTIATRAAAARPEETAGLLIDLWNADQTGTVCPQWDLFRGQDVSVAVGREQEWGKFRSLLEAGAFVDAALMRVPGGCGFDLHTEYTDTPYQLSGQYFGRIYTNGSGSCDCTAATPALALIAAIAASRGV